MNLKEELKISVLDYFQGDELAEKVWTSKYKFGDEVNPDDMHKRHVNEIAEKEFQRLFPLKLSESQFEGLSQYGKNRIMQYTKFDSFDADPRQLLWDQIIANLTEQINFQTVVLGGSPMQGIGNHGLFSSLSNCFVVDRPYDSYSGINQKEDEIAQLMKRRGGAGIDLSSIRPNGAKVHNQASTSSGVVPFADGFSFKTKQVAQYGRRGALMISLLMKHPDSLEFILSKQDKSKLTGANISVGIEDDFMIAVQNDDDYILRFPVDFDMNQLVARNIEEINQLPYGQLEEIGSGLYVKRIKARHYWETLIQCAHATAEPGILFIGNWEKGGTDWIYPQYRPIGTNPCFTGNMMLLTEDGEESFADLARKCEREGKERGKFALNLINKNNEIVPGRVWQTGIKKIITLGLDNGTIISCTPNHVFIADGEECEANDCLGKRLEAFEYSDGYEVLSIIDNGEQEVVYDFELTKGSNCSKRDKEDICHWGVINGIIAHNCSEIPMPPYDACRLLARNMYTLVKNPFTDISELLSEDKLYKAFYEQMIIGDLIVDLELDYINRIIEKIKFGTDPEDLKQSEVNIWEKVKGVAMKGRRCGAGFTGLGDMLAALNLPYFSPKEIEKVFKIKLKAELDASIDMAIQFGTFEGFDAELEKQSIYNQTVIGKEFPEQYERMLKWGRRNISMSTGAPVGSGSLMVQTTSGVEPVFQIFSKRRKKCILPTDRVDYNDPADGQAYTEYFVMHPKFITWYATRSWNENSDIASGMYGDIDGSIPDIKKYLEQLPESGLNELISLSPWAGQSAENIDWNERVEIQAIIQKYTTHAISSTINLHKDCEVSLIGDIYMQSWKSGLKGNTVYRDGSRGGVIVSASTEGEKLVAELKKSGELHKLVKKRPISIPAHYYTMSFRKKVYSVIIGFDEDNMPYELFIISGVPNIPIVFDETDSFITGEIVKDSPDWYNFESETFNVREIGDVEGDEKMISLFISILLRNNTPMKKVIKTLYKTKPIAGTFTHRLIKILSRYVVESSDEETVNKEDLCPDCGLKLKHENGCISCTCGWSKC